MKTEEEMFDEMFDEFLNKNGGSSLGSPINAAYEGFLAGYNKAYKIAFKEGQSNPKIKQLEWEYLKSYYRSNSSIYKYAIIHANDFKTDVGLYSLLINGEFLNYYAELNEAKQFAQADFERRIKECLITE